MATFDDVRRLGAAFPEAEEAPSYGGMPALKVRGKPFCHLWSEADHRRNAIEGTEVIVVFCDPDEKEALIEASDGVLFTTPHYDGYPTLLVRLAAVSEPFLLELLEDSYRSRAPERLAAAMGERRPRG